MKRILTLSLLLFPLLCLLLTSCNGGSENNGGGESEEPSTSAPTCTHESTYTQKENETAPTCEAEGGYDSVTYCGTCDARLSADRVTLDATGHTEGDVQLVTETPATCTGKGSVTEAVCCTVCGQELRRNEIEIPAKEHTKGEPVRVTVTAPTCESDGSADEVISCTVCEGELSRERVTLPAAHAMENGVCTECTRQESTAGLGFYFDTQKNGYVLTHVTSDCTAQEIVIDLYEGLPVVEISRSAFDSRDLTSVVIGADVRFIGDYAFRGCTSLRRITLRTAEGTALTVYSDAFEGCEALERVCADSLTAYCEILFTNASHPLRYASELYIGGAPVTDVTVPEGIRRIGSYAFSCESLESITIPSTVEVIGGSAFSGCTALTDVTIEHGVKEINVWAFENCSALTSIVIPDSVTKLEESILRGCDAMERITFPYFSDFENTLGELFRKKVGNVIYSEAPATLTSVTLTAVDTIGYGMLAGASGLREVRYPETVTFIGSWAFGNCTSLTRIDLPASLETLASDAFYGCDSLREIHIDDLAAWCAVNVISPAISTAAVCYPLENATLYLGGAPLTDVTVPEGVTSIGKVFAGYAALKSIALPDGITAIDDKAFKDCVGLETVLLSSTVESIGDEAFAGCAMLAEISFPEALNVIGAAAFRDSALVAAYFDSAERWSVSDVYTYVFPTEEIGNAATAASYLTDRYCARLWTKLAPDAEFTPPPEYT